MADKDKDDTEIVLDDDGVVTLDVEPKLAEAEDEGEVEVTAKSEPKPEVKKPVTRARLNEQEAVKQPAVEELMLVAIARCKGHEGILQGRRSGCGAQQVQRHGVGVMWGRRV